jgi:hypothetical protein
MTKVPDVRDGQSAPSATVEKTSSLVPGQFTASTLKSVTGVRKTVSCNLYITNICLENKHYETQINVNQKDFKK